MRNSSKIILSAANVSANSSVLDVNGVYGITVIGIFSDAASTGTIQLQGSNDVSDAGTQMPFVPTNWANIPSGSVAVTAGGVVAVEKPNLCYQWVRAVWTRTAGAGTIQLIGNIQGV